MASLPSYVILGRGRWARIIANILAAEGRNCTLLDARSPLPRSSAARIAWICVPPGPHIFSMVQDAIRDGLNVVIEKPWLCSPEETESLIALARENRVTVGIHHQFCLLSEIERWRLQYHPGRGLRFGGCFHLSRPDRLGIPALDNLGSHLRAIHAYAVPQAAISQIDCAYNTPDERQVWLADAAERLALVDFTKSQEPLIQRYIARFEASLDGADFPFDLSFARSLSA